MRAEEALMLFKEEPLCEILRLLALFEETEEKFLPLLRSGKETVLPRYGGEKREAAPPAPPEKEETAALFPDTGIEPAEPFYLTVFEREGDSFFSWETVLPEREAMPLRVNETKVTQVFPAKEKTAQQSVFSTFQTVERGEVMPLPAALRETFSYHKSENTEKAETSSLPTVDELLDELERRLIRELQETEGIY